MKKIIYVALVFGLMAPMVSEAATYGYINIHGDMRTVEAPNSAVALQLAAAQGDDLHSGVVLLSQGTVSVNQPTSNQPFANTYLYIDMHGNAKNINAASFDAARLLATDIDPRSGMMIVVGAK